jgi:hypothetical protein
MDFAYQPSLLCVLCCQWAVLPLAMCWYRGMRRAASSPSHFDVLFAAYICDWAAGCPHLCSQVRALLIPYVGFACRNSFQVWLGPSVCLLLVGLSSVPAYAVCWRLDTLGVLMILP